MNSSIEDPSTDTAAVPAAAARGPSKGTLGATVLLTSVAGLWAWIAALLPLAELAVESQPAAVSASSVDFFDMVRDDRELPLDVTEAWRKIPLVVEADDVLNDPALWNRMNFDDWDAVPLPIRCVGLERMVERHRRVDGGPQVWETMTPADWDRVPQPIRAMVFLRIAEHWVSRMDVGARHSLPPRDAADTLGALIMVESWFEHRSVNVDVEGNRDMGLPQASDFFRARLRFLYRAGGIDFELDEQDYFNPWLSIRAGAVWLDLMIDEARGDLDLAVRAYRKGIVSARLGGAEDYVQNVRRKRDRFIRNGGAPPTWDYLWRRLRRPIRRSGQG